MMHLDYSCESLIQSIFENVTTNPDRLALAFIYEDGLEEWISISQFHREASRFAVNFRKRGLQEDDILILVLDHSPELLYAFWGAMYLGAIPSIFPLLNEKLDPEFYRKQVNNLAAHSGAKAVIAGEEFEHQLKMSSGWGNCQVIGVNELVGEDEVKDFELPGGIAKHSYHREKIAFLQHSSGTTGLQKAVALSHRAVLNQLAEYAKAIELKDSDVIVSWLPLYHDMGLIAGFVMPLVLGVPLVLMSPFYWVRDPQKLLWAITKYKGTLSWLPNFAYNHMHRAIRARDLDGLDLSSWRMVINCSEPVRLDSHQMFYERFSQYGLAEKALATCYAMAENTFAVTQSKPGQVPFIDWVELAALQENLLAIPATENSPGASPVVSCGFPIDENEIQIMGQAGESLPERCVGEITIRSNSLLKEYHRRPEITAQAFKDGWFYTGDLGYLAGGQLFITGRNKDLIIVGGKNIFPADLEAIANSIRGIHPGRAVAFGVYDERMGTESIVMVCELENGVNEEEYRFIERDLRRRVAQECGVTLADVRFVESKWLVKTSSGKIARNENRTRYLRDFLGEA